MRGNLKPAERGNADGQFGLGSISEMGQGVPRSFVPAPMPYKLAAAKGGKESASNRDWVAKRMIPAEIAESENPARRWKARNKKR